MLFMQKERYMSEYINFGTKKTVLITMITSYGLAPGGYSDDIQCQLTINDLDPK